MSPDLDQWVFPTRDVPNFAMEIQMFTKMTAALAAIIATTSLFFGATEVQAQVYSNYYQGFGNYSQSTQFYGSPVSLGSWNANNIYRVQTYSPYRGYSTGQQFNSGYRIPVQNRYSVGLGSNNNWNNNNWNNSWNNSYLNGNTYYSYPVRTGTNVRYGSGGYQNRGFGRRSFFN